MPKTEIKIRCRDSSTVSVPVIDEFVHCGLDLVVTPAFYRHRASGEHVTVLDRYVVSDPATGLALTDPQDSVAQAVAAASEAIKHGLYRELEKYGRAA